MRIIRLVSSVVALWLITLSVARAQDRLLPVSRMDSPDAFALEEGSATFVPEGDKRQTVARFDDEFSLRVDLSRLSAKPQDFDLLKIDVKADAHAFLMVSLENFPNPGDLSHWYVLDGAPAALPWRTIFIDLNKPEETKRAGTYKGLADADPQARGLRLRGRIEELHRSLQGPGRTIRLGDARFVRKTVDLDWDQSQAPYTWEKGKDLIFRYPLTVTNRTDKPVTASLVLSPVGTKQATAALSQSKVALKPHETQKVEARLTLPAAAAAQAAPLYCERVEAKASIEGQPDSEVTILRSSDVIPLSVTVPFPEEKLAFPLLPRIREVPEWVTRFGARQQPAAIRLAQTVSPDDLTAALDGPLTGFDRLRGFEPTNRRQEAWWLAGERFKDGLTACAFLYDLSGDKGYLERGERLLLKAADAYLPRAEEWRKIPYSPISHGIFSSTTLYFGWVTGSMRWPYSFERHGMFNDFDLLAKDMDPAAREKIIRDFLVPVAIQMRNHYIGLSNQQDVVNYAVLYAGLAARNWPLVSHAYDSTHGLLRQIEFAFDDEGMAGEANYHKPSIEPILCACELLRPRGIDLYDQRLYTILHSRSAAVVKAAYNSPMLTLADQSRFADKDIKPPPPSDGLHLATGVTLLRWKGLEAAMNWGLPQNRSAPDRSSLRVGSLGGGNYTHSSLGQSIIIVDEGRQNPETARVLGYDVDGPVQFICAESEEHYPGSRITRLFALVGEGVLVLDRVRNDRPRTVDWCLKDAGDRVDLPMRETPGGFTNKPDDKPHATIFGAHLKFDRHFQATTDGPWNEGSGRLAMAGEKDTRVFSFRVPASFSAGKAGQQGVPVLMVRRSDVRQTDFVAFFSTRTKSVERIPVLNADGSDADALGARVVLGTGKVIHALVNYQPGTAVHVGKLTTSELFATDVAE